MSSTSPTQDPTTPVPGHDIRVRFLQSNLEAPWDPASESLLEFAEALGLEPPFSCRAGVCSTCVTALRRGAVSYFQQPVCEPAPGEVLLCCSRPTESVELDL
jgi:ferredoxin